MTYYFFTFRYFLIYNKVLLNVALFLLTIPTMHLKNTVKTIVSALILFSLSEIGTARAEDLVSLTRRATQSTVAIALHSPLKHTAPAMKGTGFVIYDGRFVVTNYHVVDHEVDTTIVEYFVAMLPKSDGFAFQKLNLLEVDLQHDLALFAIESALTPLQLASEELSPAGTDIAIFGYPLGAALGLFPAVHKGIIATITPDYMPVSDSRLLSAQQLERLKKPDLIYQLDITAYPGNSGSPVVDIKSGEVIAVINKVYVKDSKESALTDPSGISYGIPVKHVNALLQRALAKMDGK